MASASTTTIRNRQALGFFSKSAYLKWKKESMNRVVNSTTIISHSSLVDIQVEYSQPRVRARNIFGLVVPYGRMWRAGANGCTTLFASQDLHFEQGTLPRGKYALYIVPREESWKIVFYADTSNYGLPRCWEERSVVLAFNVPVQKLDRLVESLSISIEQTSHYEASLDIAWETTRVSVPFAIPSQSNALENAAPATGGPSFDDYYMAAKFCYETGDLQGALLRIEMGLELNYRKPYFYLHFKAQIEAKLGQFADAALDAKKALVGATEANDPYSVHLAEADLAEWSQKLEHPVSQQVEA
jgi:hypothetical protein